MPAGRLADGLIGWLAVGRPDQEFVIPRNVSEVAFLIRRSSKIAKTETTEKLGTPWERPGCDLCFYQLVYMLAPSWATRYKFVVKENVTNYETIFSQFFVADGASNSVYFLIEGENAAKLNAGDRLQVKADSGGPTTSCVTTTVLEKLS